MYQNGEKLQWKAYPVEQTDIHGYGETKFGVREEYDDGATRFIHNELFETREEAVILASRFNLHVRKGKQYDNVMKQWS